MAVVMNVRLGVYHSNVKDGLLGGNMWSGAYQNVTRQWAVGHGGFFTQRIEFTSYMRNPVIDRTRAGLLTMIYDCGAGRSAKPSQALKDAVDEFVSTRHADEMIDVIVISHLDRDHVNGLAYLSSALRQTNTHVRRVWMPMLSPMEALMVASTEAAEVGVNTDLVSLALNPTEFISDRFPDAELSRLTSSEEPIPLDLGIDFETRQSGPDSFGRAVAVDVPGRSGVYVRGLESNGRSTLWEVLPFVTASTSAASAVLEQDVRKLIGKDPNKADPHDALKLSANKALVNKFNKELKKHMKTNKTVIGGQTASNLSSVCVYSGPVDPYDWCRHRAGWGNGNAWAVPVAPGWLGTGDASLSGGAAVRELTDKLTVQRMDRVGITSAPHHGSKHNSGAELWSALPNVRHVTTQANNVGGGSGNAHPHSEVLGELSSRNVSHHATTAQVGSEFDWVDRRLR